MMQSIEFTDSGLDVLHTLVGHTTGDPRKHGLIGICFWRMDFTPDDEQKIQEIYSSLEQKLNQNES